jgi:Mg2+/citrate symporter
MTDGSRGRINGRISREDIEAQLRTILGDADEAVGQVRSRLVPSAVVAAVAVVLLAYLLGRRSGRRRSAVVEIHRL